jgi:hypothetical protein
MTTDEFRDKINELRKEIRDVGSVIKSLMNDPIFIPANLPKISDAGEMKANIMLSYRHMEDARLRLGIVLQACDGGVYDK